MAADTPDALLLQEQLLRRARDRAAGRSTRPSGAAGQDPDRPGPAPLTHAQRRMWLMDRLGRTDASYNVPFATRLRGRLDVDALGAALTALVRRHQILRTRYGQRDGEPYQEVMRAPDRIDVPVVDVGGGAAPALLDAEAGRPFDLASGPVPRALVLRHGPEDHTVLLTFHHIAVDGPSLEVVAEELAFLYAGMANGIGTSLPERAPQYAEFSHREHAAAADFGAGLDHWAERLRGVRPLRLPGPVGPSDAPGTASAGLHTTPLDPHVIPALRELGGRHRATLFTVALAAAFASLHRCTGDEDLVVGIASTHRRGSAMRRLVGLCVNTLPVRVDLSGDPSFAVLLDRVREALLQAQEHRDVPFDLILERLGATARGADGTGLVRVTSDVLGRPTTLALPGLVAAPVEAGGAGAKFDLSFGLVDTDRPAGLVQYHRAAVDGAAAADLGRDHAALLAAVAADPGLTLSRLPGARAVPDESSGHPAETVLQGHPQVDGAVVVAPAGGPPLAYAVLRGIGGPTPAELRSFLRAALAPEHLPSAVVLLDAVPRSVDGAVDTARLPGVPSAADPEGPRARAVHDGFTTLLGRTPGPDDDFFALGGHSLTAVQLAERLRTVLTLPLTGLDVMQARTPRALTALLDARAEERASAAPARSSRPRRRREGTVLVTGGTGGVGAFVLRELAARGRPVLALARPESAHLVAGSGVDVVEGDLQDLDGLRTAVEGADAVVHAACTFTRPEVDVAAMRAMVDAWRRGPFVFVSSVDAYGRPAARRVAEESPPCEPLSDYGRGKLDCEALLLRAAGTEGRGGASAVRSPIVWGPHDRLRDQLRWGATGLLYQEAARSRPIALPRTGAGGHAWYGVPWVHAAALARAVTACLDTPLHGVANAVSGHVAWQDLTADLAALLGSTSEIRLVDEFHPDLDHRWHYDAVRLAPALRERRGEDRRSVLAEMIDPSGG
ncbi:condensation domain-containing protein [Streptomyces sp. NPDC059176]|uniref:condensation domain-containing protein n=1 Tax=unclassified Streptomyces TaxID=2593676 RepID=UPI0036B52274